MNHDNSNANIGEKKGFCSFAYLSPLAVIALSFGYAVGWGAFVMPGTTFLPSAGPLDTVIGVLFGALAMGIFAINYHRLTVRYSGPGTTLAKRTGFSRSPSRIPGAASRRKTRKN